MPLWPGDPTEDLLSTDQFLNPQQLEQHFLLGVQTWLGEVPGTKFLVPAEIGVAFDLPLSFVTMLDENEANHPLFHLCLQGTPSKFLQEVMHHIVMQLTEQVGQIQWPPEVVNQVPCSHQWSSSRHLPQLERTLPPWARVCKENEKAAKADEAKPNVPMWDLRVQAHRPDLSPEFLEQFRTLNMWRWKLWCYVSFHQCMGKWYGDG
jgi:hypothetical protein